MEDYVMGKPEAGAATSKKPWTKPVMEYDGELRDFVQGTMKPTHSIGEPGDPGQKPQAS